MLTEILFKYRIRPASLPPEQFLMALYSNDSTYLCYLVRHLKTKTDPQIIEALANAKDAKRLSNYLEICYDLKWSIGLEPSHPYMLKIRDTLVTGKFTDTLHHAYQLAKYCSSIYDDPIVRERLLSLRVSECILNYIIQTNPSDEAIDALAECSDNSAPSCRLKCLYYGYSTKKLLIAVKKDIEKRIEEIDHDNGND